jgi:hypothetical protein
MAVKIGGFAAFAIALVVVAGVERVVHTVCNRRHQEKPRPRPKQEAFWADFSTQLTMLREQTPAISPDDLATKLKESLQKAYDAALAECPNAYEVDQFLEQLDKKLDALSRMAPAQ